VKNRQIDGTLDVEPETPRTQLLLKNGTDAEFLPKAAENEVGTDALNGNRFGLTGGMGINDGELLAEAQTGTKQGVELAAGLENIEAAEGGKDALLDALLLPKALDDLEIGIGSGAFNSEEHAACWLPRRKWARPFVKSMRIPYLAAEFATTNQVSSLHTLKNANESAALGSESRKWCRRWV
jgi:hypothetical protein